MPQVYLSPQAADWIKKRVAKTARRYQSLPENQARKEAAAIKHWTLLAKKVNEKGTPKEDGRIHYDLRRLDLKSIQGLVLESIVQLNSKVLPEYQRRASEKGAHYIEYYTKTQALIEELGKLLEQINTLISEAR